jgi:hypothetical protein
MTDKKIPKIENLDTLIEGWEWGRDELRVRRAKLKGGGFVYHCYIDGKYSAYCETAKSANEWAWGILDS